MNESWPLRRRAAALFSLLLLAVALLARGDEPPPWREFEVKSANGRFIAEVKVRPGHENKRPREREYVLSVYEALGAEKRKVWSTTYVYDGYPQGMLSDDGAAFVYVDDYYQEDGAVISIYRAGQERRTLRGSAFNVDPSALQPTVSHALWLNDEVTPVQFSSANARPLVLLVRTRDKRLHRVDVATGRLLD